MSNGSGAAQAAGRPQAGIQACRRGGRPGSSRSWIIVGALAPGLGAALGPCRVLAKASDFVPRHVLAAGVPAAVAPGGVLGRYFRPAPFLVVAFFALPRLAALGACRQLLFRSGGGGVCARRGVGAASLRSKRREGGGHGPATARQYGRVCWGGGGGGGGAGGYVLGAGGLGHGLATTRPPGE